ncbi:Con-6 family protein [Aspergillus clavatus NRRL 1]|uniref:Conidiation protein Con-6 n=1 Tax=Aspergillus clavatus (strain ATCC 1007 / CBS 513.65 / DSM 816 / NCTC 3887 / NRRL 1 / QM 1276 / 107) TaxID=344612 RepID=A1C9A9_ASPCL|nr:uncharacterized protein ACLA_054800 [Aspergillus clavatus NRRL 1]EAW13433.1 conserved hypothetical protein [Aspergillus clavatus NRRL 1]
MGREGAPPENVIRGYKATDQMLKTDQTTNSTLKNQRVSKQAKQHAQQELDKYESDQGPSGDERHASNVKRGLKAATHNPNVTDMGKKQAREKLQAMGQEPDQPSD